MGKNTERGPLPLWRKWVRIAEGVAKHKKTNKNKQTYRTPAFTPSKKQQELTVREIWKQQCPKDMTQSKPIWAPDLTSDFKPVTQRLQCRRHMFDPWVRKILWRKCQPTPVFLPRKHRKIYGNKQWSLVGHSPQSCKESDMT